MTEDNPRSVKIYLALGTNLGDRMTHLAAAQEHLARILTITARSPVYETPPWGFTDQPAFLNMVLAADVSGAPDSRNALKLLNNLKQIETVIGRLPTFRNGPRVIDIDILLFGNLCINLDGLTIPHPRMAERQFVLVPLADIAPDLVHPVSGLTVRQMLERLDEPVTARLFDHPIQES